VGDKATKRRIGSSFSLGFEGGLNFNAECIGGE
jgi:hypothetical protein